MAVSVCRKIEEMRRLKRNRSEWRSTTSIEIVEDHVRVKPESETRDVLADLFPSDLVQGESLKRLDDLPTFGTSSTDDSSPGGGSFCGECWRRRDQSQNLSRYFREVARNWTALPLQHYGLHGMQ